MKKIVIITASDNENLKLARKFKLLMSKKNCEIVLWNLITFDLPMYTQQREKKEIPENIFVYMNILESADCAVFVTPEYNGGVPPILSNFLAWISRSGKKDWRKCFNKKKAVLATHSGNGGLRVLAALRLQLSYLGMNIIGREIVTTFDKELNQNDLVDVIDQLVDGL